MTFWLINGEMLKQLRVSGLYVEDCKEWVNHRKFSKQKHLSHVRAGRKMLGPFFPHGKFHLTLSFSSERN